VPDAWIDGSKIKVGYEIPFNRHFYKYTPPRPLEEIKAEMGQVQQNILKLLAEVAG
jgi:type I restriction enzyme M protein